MFGNMQMRRIRLRISPVCQTIKSDHDDQSALTARVFCAQIRTAVAPEHVPLPRIKVHHFQFRYMARLCTGRVWKVGVPLCTQSFKRSMVLVSLPQHAAQIAY